MFDLLLFFTCLLLYSSLTALWTIVQGVRADTSNPTLRMKYQHFDGAVENSQFVFILRDPLVEIGLPVKEE